VSYWIRYSDLTPSNALANPTALAHPLCAAVSYRTAHNSLQPNQPASFPTSNPNDPSWNWSFFDSAVAQATQYGKPFFLRVFFQGNNAPAWMQALAQQFVDVGGTEYNVWWDANFQAGVKAVIQAIAARYGSNALFQYCSFNIVTQSSGDWSMPHATGSANYIISNATCVCHAYGATTNFPITGQAWGVVGQVGFISGFGWFQITGVFGNHLQILNLGTAGNASSGTIPAGAAFQIDDVATLHGPVYNYTTAQLVNAQTAIIQACNTALPNVIYDQEVGRNGTLDPFPGGTTYAYNAATQIAQWAYANIPAGKFAIGKNTFQPYNDTPASALSKQENSDIYLPAQTIAGSSSTSGTTGSIPAKSMLFLQQLWPIYDPSGKYSPSSTASGNGPYGATGGKPYGAADIYNLWNQTSALAQQYDDYLLEVYERDLLALVQPIPMIILALPQSAEETVDQAVYDGTYAQGVSLRGKWKDIQPTATTWNWNYFDTEIARAAAAGKTVMLRVNMTNGSCPGWVKNQVQEIIDTNTGEQIQVYYDSKYISLQQAFWQAAATRYANNPVVKYIAINPPGTGGGDWAIPYQNPGNWHTNTPWTVPAVNGTVTLTPDPTKSNPPIYQGVWIYVQGSGPGFIGWFYVQSVNGSNAHPTSIVLQNQGTSGNVAPGTSVPITLGLSQNMINIWYSPIYQYTTAKVVQAIESVAATQVAGFTTQEFSMSCGTNGGLDTNGNPAYTEQTMAYTIVTDLYNLYGDRFRMAKNGFRACTPPYGNNAGTIWQIFNMCPQVRREGQYYWWSYQDLSGSYLNNCGTPFDVNHPDANLAAGNAIAQGYGVERLEMYMQDVLYLQSVQPPIPPGPAADGLVVAPYAGQNQQQVILVPAKTALQGWDGEEGPWVMPPYAQIFDYDSQADAQTQAWVPPPVKQTDIFSAQQTWPL